ncbi:MAG: hypothetical protein WD029_05730 [Microthrixaceae bacterium]
MSGPSTAESSSAVASSRRQRQRGLPVDDAFDLLYPIAVGIGRRILDRRGENALLSVKTAEQLATEIFVHLPRPLLQDEKALAKLCSLMAEGCMSHLVGDRSLVVVPLELLPPETGFFGELPLCEIQATLSEMRRVDRSVGLLVLAAGLSPSQAATALALPLDRALNSLHRIGMRMQDRQVLGLGPKFESTSA